MVWQWHSVRNTSAITYLDYVVECHTEIFDCLGENQQGHLEKIVRQQIAFMMTPITQAKEHQGMVSHTIRIMAVVKKLDITCSSMSTAPGLTPSSF